MTSHGMRGENGANYTDKFPYMQVYRSRCNDQDIKSILIAQMNAQGEGSIPGGADYRWNFDATTSQQPPTPSSGQYLPTTPAPKPESSISSSLSPNSKFGISDRYLYFDTLSTLTSSLSQGEVTFSVPALNNNFPLENIIEMEIGSFYFPDIVSPNYYPSPFFYNRVTMIIKEVSAQQTIQGSDNFRFHFEFDVSPAGIAKLLTPVNAKYIFTKPINSLQQVTFQFRNPRYPIPLPIQSLVIPWVKPSAPASFNLVGSGAPTQASTTYAIQILNWVPNQPTSTATSTAIIERTGGNLGDVDPTNSFMTLQDAASSIGITDTVTGANVLFMANRFAFVIRFRLLINDITQYITPV